MTPPDVINRLLELLGPDLVGSELDPPAVPSGDWWIELRLPSFITSVVWSEARGFGVYTSQDEAYGASPDEVFEDPALAAGRVRQLASDAAAPKP